MTGYQPPWARVEFGILDPLANREKVEDWLTRNVKATWSLAVYQTGVGDESATFMMAVYFSDPQDAILFKLRDGHQCWRDG